MLSNLSDQEVVDSYIEAKRLGLDKEFIRILKEEIVRRIESGDMKVKEMGIDPKLFD